MPVDHLQKIERLQQENNEIKAELASLRQLLSEVAIRGQLNRVAMTHE
jgi:cell shape-determining protein MreC